MTHNKHSADTSSKTSCGGGDRKMRFFLEEGQGVRLPYCNQVTRDIVGKRDKPPFGHFKRGRGCGGRFLFNLTAVLRRFHFGRTAI